MDTRQVSDSKYEALFRQAVIDNFYNELDSLPPREELAKMYVPSESHKARMKKLFVREARRENVLTFAKWSRRVAVAIMIVATVLCVTLMSVPQVQAMVAQTVTDWYKKFVMFSFKAPDTEKAHHEPKFIPEDFVEIIREESETIITIIYENKDKGATIVFQSARTYNQTSIDIDDTSYTKFVINGEEYYLLNWENIDSEKSIVWYANSWRYEIISTIPIGELINIARYTGA